MAEMKKITAHVPADLLESATRSSGLGVTEAVREGLKLLARKQAYEELRKLRGKIHFDIDLKELRKDRR